MANSKEKEAANYLKKCNIVELMNNLTSMLLFYRPEDPMEFLIDQLEQLKVSKQRSIEGPSLFNDSNLDTILGILDPTKQGYITYAQYKEALATLGIHNINESRAGEDRISHGTFKTDVKEGLLRS